MELHNIEGICKECGATNYTRPNGIVECTNIACVEFPYTTEENWPKIQKLMEEARKKNGAT